MREVAADVQHLICGIERGAEGNVVRLPQVIEVDRLLRAKREALREEEHQRETKQVQDAVHHAGECNRRYSLPGPGCFGFRL
jgi:hypothetical protein